MPEGRHNRIGPRLPGEEKKEVPAKCRCIHPDCIYRARPYSEGKWYDNGCNYILITGHSRIKGLKEEQRDPALCQRYEPGKRKKMNSKIAIV